jgi:hypothetical protein
VKHAHDVNFLTNRSIEDQKGRDDNKTKFALWMFVFGSGFRKRRNSIESCSEPVDHTIRCVDIILCNLFPNREHVGFCDAREKVTAH